MSARTQFAGPRVPSLPERFRLKVIGLGVRGYFAFKRLRYRLRRRPGGKLLHPDHITIPCGDLRVAEEFYVGLLGADVMMRINRRLLQRIGWADEDIDANRAVHLSLTLGAGPRLDLFRYPEGEPRHDVVMHPHIALMTTPGKFPGWKRRLEAEGVRTTEIRRPGPPGQASFYFNDPFGNHLELITLGFVAHDLEPGVPDRSRLNYQWRRARATAKPLPKATLMAARELDLRQGLPGPGNCA